MTRTAVKKTSPGGNRILTGKDSIAAYLGTERWNGQGNLLECGAFRQSINEAKKCVDFTILTRGSEPNRYGNLVQIVEGKNGRGMMTDTYATNPVVLFDHGMSGYTLPIATSKGPGGELAVRKTKTEMSATAFFLDSKEADEIFSLILQDGLKMSSVGFIPRLAIALKVDPPKLEEGVVSMEYGRGLDITESELMEWSITAIGADRGALRQCAERGKITGSGALSPFMRQWLSTNAEERPAIGIGFGSEIVTQSAEGESDADESDDDEDPEVDTDPETDGGEHGEEGDPVGKLSARVDGLETKMSALSVGMETLLQRTAPKSQETPEETAASETTVDTSAENQSIASTAEEIRQATANPINPEFVQAIGKAVAEHVQTVFQPIVNQQAAIHRRISLLVGDSKK